MTAAAIIDTAMQSPFLAGGGLLLALAIGLTILKGLIGLAKRIALVGGIVLLIYGAVNAVAPELIPFLV